MRQSTDHDHILTEVRRKLHDPRGSRAAVMVGAGFSCNSVPLQSKAKSFPTWSQLTHHLASRLYPSKDSTNIPQGTDTTLRLAQEFEVAFGRSALMDVVRTVIPDDAFAPARLHRSLLELPWSDVFTTNYDCQLEKSCRWVWRQRYSVVRCVADIPIARSPRIVKLHGSLPDLTNLILTEEDFRTYPRRFAPFVNLVVTSLTENSFCLIGFSGTDPNFLEWTGWVRDELGTSAPYIYYFTYPSVPLKSFQRQLLEDRHVIPIDLRERYGACTVAKAHESLLDELRNPVGPKVPVWNQSRRFVSSNLDPSIAKEPFFPKSDADDDWKETVALWREHRLSFRGWVLLPQHACERLADDANTWMSRLNKTIVSGWSFVDRLTAAREIAWRCEAAFVPLHDDFIAEIIDPLLSEWDDLEKRPSALTDSCQVTGVTEVEVRDAVCYLQRQCLRHSREIGSEDRFRRFLDLCKEHCRQLDATSDPCQFVAHQCLLFHLGRLEHAEALRLLEDWNVDGSDPLWMVRRAGLCLECGHFSEAKANLEKAFQCLRRTTPDSPDYHGLSIEGIVLFLHRCIERPLGRGSAPQNENLSPNDDSAVSRTTHEKEEVSLHRPAHPLVDSGVEVPEPQKVPGLPEATLQDIDDREISDRLNDLHVHGCEPIECFYWLQDVLEFRPQSRLGEFEEEKYDIGRVVRHFSSGDHKPLLRAYQAIRFLEDAGIPLRVEDTVTVTVGEKLFASAAMVVAQSSSQEGLGLVLRSQSKKLIGEFLSRRTVAGLTEQQVAHLYSVGQRALQSAIASMGRRSGIRTQLDTWCERQVAVACTVLERMAARSVQQDLRVLLQEVLPLMWDERLTRRVSGHDDVNVVVQRCCGLLTSESVSSALSLLVESPVLGEERFSKASVIVGRWVDPIVALDCRRVPRNGEIPPAVAKRVDELIERVRSGNEHERANCATRLFVMNQMGLLGVRQRGEFVGALFSHTDSNGLPEGTHILSSALLLSLPRTGAGDERRRFRDSILKKSVLEGNDWRVLAMTVARFGAPREEDRRSIQWTQSDLDVILDHASNWINANVEAIQDSLTPKEHDFFGMHSQRSHEMLMYYRAWLETIEDVILLAPRVTQGRVDRGAEILGVAQQRGLSITKTLPTLCQHDLFASDDVERHIRRDLASRDSDRVWQACCGIVRWGELTRAGRQVPISMHCISDVGFLCLQRRHERMPLLLNTVRDLVVILEDGVGDEFVENAISSLDALLSELSYSDESTDLTVNKKILLRQISTKLVAALWSRGIQHSVLDSWGEAAKNDEFEDVRRVAHDPGAAQDL